MDAVSYSLASKQAQRIEKFIENPDSTSGIVTVPKTIASGETVTVPAGRVAVLPNVVVDGTLNIDGEVFIPSGSSVDFSNGIKIDGNNIALSIPTSYHLLQGNLSVSNEVITNGFSTTLYTGNGGTQAINTGVDMSTQWGNDVSETFGGLVWLKSRSAATNNYFVDTVRGATKDIYSNATTAETTEATGLTSFNSTGFNLGTLAEMNTNLATYASWNFQTTHRRTGVTNHGKAYTEHYNPFTGFTIIKYEGSGIVGHEIPHSLGRKLGLFHTKNLSVAKDWLSCYSDNNTVFINLTNASVSNTGIFSTDYNATVNISTGCNTTSQQYIMYGWANSYLDETNKLIGNYLTTIDSNGILRLSVHTNISQSQIIWQMSKTTLTTGDFDIVDFTRGNTKELNANLPAIESTIAANTLVTTASPATYYRATDTSNVQINNAIIPLAHGVDSNGSKNSIVVANETITGVTYTQGKNYLYKTDTGYGVNPYKPRYLSSELVRRFAGEQPDYFNVDSNKWFNTDAGVELVANGKFTDGTTTGWTLSGIGSISVDSGNLKLLSSSAANVYTYTTINTTNYIGKNLKLKVSYTRADVARPSLVKVGLSPGTTEYINSSLGLVTGTYEFNLTPNTNSTVISLQLDSNANGQYSEFDNISVYPTDIIPTTEITESRNYMNHVVHADASGNVLYVEELPKVEYKDIIKANKYLGSNAVSLSVAFDLTTTPIAIKGKMIGAKALIRTSAGTADIYLNDDLKGMELKLDGISNGNQVRVLAIADDKITIETSNSSGAATSYTYTSINGVGE